ncbi:MAG: proteasome subunit beta [Acidilobaceae archaeon]
MAQLEDFLKATVLGLKVREGVVLATDRRLTLGDFVISRNATKVFLLKDRVAVAFAGLYGDIAGLVRILDSEVRAYETIAGSPLSIKAIAKRLSTLLYSYKMFPFVIEAVVGGVERTGEPRLYSLDSLGSLLEEEYVAVGSGAATALGLLEREYRSDVSIEEAEKLAISAVRAAISRDVGSGDGIDVVSITPSGVRRRSLFLRLVES